MALVTSPVEIELEKLQTNTAFLSTQAVESGTYNSLTLTFANPELTILNQSGQVIVIGTQVCAIGQVCELKPQLNTSSVTLSGAPFPLNVSGNAAAGLALDFDVNSAIQGNLSITPALSVSQVTASNEELEEDQELVGKVITVGNGQLTLQKSSTGQSFNIQTTSNTEFSDFSQIGCQTNDLSCVKAGQIVEVDVKLMTTGSLSAKEVQLEQGANINELDGTVVSVNPAGNQFQMVVLDEEPVINGAPVGSLVTVNIQSGASFQVEADGLILPSGLAFTNVGDLVAGQEVEVRALSTTSGATGASESTDLVRLRAGQISGKVSSVSSSGFAINNLSSLFTGAGINQIQVQTSSSTEFEGVAGVSALSVNNDVSVGGLLFKSSGDPALVAKEVRKR